MVPLLIYVGRSIPAAGSRQPRTGILAVLSADHDGNHLGAGWVSTANVGLL